MSNRTRHPAASTCEPFCMPCFDLDRCVSADEFMGPGGAEEVERAAFERGFAQGERAGFEMGERKAGVLLGKVEELIHDLALLKKGMTGEAEAEAVELACALARKIVLRELSLEPATLVEITKEALSRLQRGGQVTIRIHPAVQELFLKHKPELLGLHPDVVISADASVSPAGSILTGPSEDVSTDIDEQLAVIRTEMKDGAGHD